VRKDAYFWIVMLMRGIVALLMGSMVLIIPDMARTLLLLPLAMVIAILGLATYGVVDSAFVLVSSFMTESRAARAGLLVQGSVGISIGLLLLIVVFEKVHLEWFLILGAFQAACAGVGEMVVAKHARTHEISRWNYAAGAIALVSSIGYLTLLIGFANRLNSELISWLLYGYLIAFGIAQSITAARMLYADRRFFLGGQTALYEGVAQ